jgi:internalin A
MPGEAIMKWERPMRRTRIALLCLTLAQFLACCGLVVAKVRANEAQEEALARAGSLVTEGGRKGNYFEIDHIGECGLVTTADLFGANQTDKALACLQRRCPNVKQLTLTFSGATNNGLRHVTNLESLEDLCLGRTRVTDAGMTLLGGMTNLKKLCLAINNVTDVGLSHISGLPQLEELDISMCRVTDEGLVVLKRMPRLRRLNLGSNNLSNAGLMHLRELSQLEELNLHFNRRITDDGLAHLATLTNLKTLDLSYTTTSDEGLAHLRALRGLRRLGLFQTSVTDAGREHLKEDLPNTHIIHANRSHF